MKPPFRLALPAALLALGLLLAACAPAATPSPTAATAQPAATTEPAKPAATAPAAQQPAATAAAKPDTKAADSEAAEAFFKGKTIRLIVGLAAGGGFDAYARLIARYLDEYIPGKPNVIVENMPGAGSLVATNTVYHTAPKDGTTIVHFTGSMILQQLIGGDGIEFDGAQFRYLGAPTPDTPACAVMKSAGFTSLADATDTRELIVGGTAPGVMTDDTPNVLRNVLGLNLKVVTGYGGTSQIRLAAERGEVHGGCWQWESIKPTWEEGLASGEVVVIGQGGRTAHPDLPNVPIMRELAKTDEQRQLIDAGITSPGEFYRPFALPPGVPAERVAALQEAFLATLKDQRLVADAEKAKLVINPISGPELEQRVKEVLALPPDTAKKLEQALQPS